jgi:hypothetical protein
MDSGCRYKEKRLMQHVLRLIVIAATAAVLPAMAQGPKVDLIHLDPQPSISGGCPAKVHFTGRIRTNGPMEVTYEWLRSDGSHTEHTLNFQRAMTHPVSIDWNLSKTMSGWMQLVILSPRRMQTVKANFSVNCGR